jgi:hypothetical protein
VSKFLVIACSIDWIRIFLLVRFSILTADASHQESVWPTRLAARRFGGQKSDELKLQWELKEA